MKIGDITVPEAVQNIVFPDTFTESQKRWSQLAIAISATNERPHPLEGAFWDKVFEYMKPSQITFLQTEMAKAAGAALPPLKIYIRWDMNADSWSGTRTIRSIHQTLEGAIAAVPENMRTKMERPVEDRGDIPNNFPVYVKNYTYEAIEEKEISA